MATTTVELTPMQKKVHNLLSDNLLNKQIAFALGITEATVKMHVSAILKKLGAKNRKEAGFYGKISGAVVRRWVRLPEELVEVDHVSHNPLRTLTQVRHHLRRRAVHTQVASDQACLRRSLLWRLPFDAYSAASA